MRNRLAILLCSGAVACSAPNQLTELALAEKQERAGRLDEALASYHRAKTTCRDLEPLRTRRAACAHAHLGYAEVLVSMQQLERAAEAYSAIPAALPEDIPTSANATLRAGELYLQLDRPELGYASLWRTVTDYPNEAFAWDALKVLLRDGRRRNARELAAELNRLYAALDHTRIADNILYALAELHEQEFDDPDGARALYDRLTTDHPESGLKDDAWWHGARLARSLGDHAGAARRLRALLDTREVAWGPGSYFSVWLDNAQLELGRTLRDGLRDYPGAIAAFKQLPVDYPASVLHDDALYERAVTRAAMGEKETACRLLGALKKAYPDSKYLLERAPALATQQNCPAAE